MVLEIAAEPTSLRSAARQLSARCCIPVPAPITATVVARRPELLEQEASNRFQHLSSQVELEASASDTVFCHKAKLESWHPAAVAEETVGAGGNSKGGHRSKEGRTGLVAAAQETLGIVLQMTR